MMYGFLEIGAIADNSGYVWKKVVCKLNSYSTKEKFFPRKNVLCYAPLAMFCANP